MEAKCSCPVCDTFSCYSKQSHRCVDSDDEAMIAKTHPPFDFKNTLLLADEKIDIEENKESKETDKESDQLSETASVTTIEDTLNDNSEDFEIIPNSKNTFRPSAAAKLSAQVMNFPFKEYQNSMSQQKIASQTNIAKLTSFDIFEKIKEVYKACSCKVCECIIGKTPTNQVCNCKPCDCEDCNSKGRVTISNTFRAIEVAQAEPDYQRFGSGFFSSFVGGDQEINQSCKCKPCECTQCFTNVSSPCKCKRCSCVECDSRYQRNYQKLVVAAVKSDNQNRQECMCTPCHCAECSHRYGASSSLRHEVSTEIMRHFGCHCEACNNESCAPEGSDACSCERGKQVVRKPVQRDTTDFDIHRSIVTHQKIGINKTKHDLIAMFAAISKTYTGYHQTNQCCTCGRCGCMYCNLKFTQSSADAVKSSTVSFDSIDRDLNGNMKSETTPDYKVSTKKSCLKTSIRNDNFNFKTMYTNHQKLSTEIKTTNYFSFDTNKSESNNDHKLESCTGDVCDCDICKCGRCLSKEDDVIYPIKKGEKLAPYLFGRNINKSNIRFCDKYNEVKEEDYETPAKKARIATEICITKAHDKRGYLSMKYLNNDIPNKKSKLKIEQQPFIEIPKTTIPKFSSHIFAVIETSNNQHLACGTDKSVGDDTSDGNKIFNTTNSCDNSIMQNDLKCNKMEKKIDVHDVLSKKIFEQLNYTYQSPPVKSIPKTFSSCNKTIKTDTVNHENKLVCNKIQPNEELVLIKGNNINKKYDMNEEMKNILGKDENYKRVENTLKEARAFTQRLMELLNKYEKANREFESVYNKISNTNNNPYIVQNMTVCPETDDVLKQPEKINSKDVLLTQKENVQEHKNQPICYLKAKESLQNLLEEIGNNSKRDLIPNKSGDYIDNADQLNLTQDKERLDNTSQGSKTSDDFLIEFKEYSSNTFSMDSSIVTDDVIKCESGLNPIIETTISPLPQLKYSERRKRRRSRRFGQMYKQAVIASKRSKLFAPQIAKCSIMTGISKEFLEKLKDDDEKQSNPKQANDIMKENTDQRNSVDEITKEVGNVETGDNIASNNLDNSQVDHNDNTIQQKNDRIQFPEVTKSQEVKHESFKATDSEVTLGVYRKRSLGKGIKEAVNAIKQASVTWEANFATNPKSQGNEALSKLHLEVKKLLDLPLLQKCDIAVEGHNLHRADRDRRVHNCDALKVSFLAAHQMSDRTIVVTWLAPRDLDYVQGYEVLVNGRIAQKIHDQTCCETILSHLPRSEKILLTVRTLTKSKCLSGHSPSSTVVYKTSTHSRLEKNNYEGADETCMF